MLRRLTHRFSELYGPQEARALALVVLEDACGLTQTDLCMGKDRELSAKTRGFIEEIADKIVQGMPVQYALGRARFRGRMLSVGPGCLVPRHETEDLVDIILHHFIGEFRVLDVGTCSGAIALSLALEGGADVTAWDVSDTALGYARKNFAEHGAEVCAELVDIFCAEADVRRWDAIVSNPPYVCQSEAKEMAPHVLNHEPHLALFVPDDDSLRFYRAIARFALSHLKEGGSLFFELNPASAHDCLTMLTTMGFREASLANDRYGKCRFATARL